MSDEHWTESEQGCWMRRAGTFHDSACIVDGVLHVNAQAVITHIPLDVLAKMLSRAGLAIVPAADVVTPEERAVLEACAGAEVVSLSNGWRMLDGDSNRAAAEAELARRAAREQKGSELPHGIPEGENDKGWPEGTPESVTKGKRNI